MNEKEIEKHFQRNAIIYQRSYVDLKILIKSSKELQKHKHSNKKEKDVVQKVLNISYFLKDVLEKLCFLHGKYNELAKNKPHTQRVDYVKSIVEYEMMYDIYFKLFKKYRDELQNANH